MLLPRRHPPVLVDLPRRRTLPCFRTSHTEQGRRGGRIPRRRRGTHNRAAGVLPFHFPRRGRYSTTGLRRRRPAPSPPSWHSPARRSFRSSPRTTSSLPPMFLILGGSVSFPSRTGPSPLRRRPTNWMTFSALITGDDGRRDCRR